MHTEIQDKVFDEIYRILPSNSTELSLNTINDLKYLDMVVKESLRLLPVVPFIARKVSGDFKLGKETFLYLTTRN